MSEIQDLVIRSSRMMAAVRALETKRADGLFKDPLAALLAGDDMIAEIAPSVQQYEDQGKPIVAVRTRFFDDFLMSQIAQIRQVVILGAGMDTIAFRLPWHPNTHLYELNCAEVIQYKESVLRDIQSQCPRYTLGIDLREPWSEQRNPIFADYATRDSRTIFRTTGSGGTRRERALY